MAPSGRITFVLNGQAVDVDLRRPPVTLLDFLRDRGLTGAKEGCAEGECGACMVVLVGGDGGRATYRPVNSCLLLLPQAAHHEILTVEALAADGRLVDAQAALAAAGGSQCGYCTPGFVMSLFAEQYRPDRNGPCDPLAMGGNLCRCTGYRPIRDAALAVGVMPDDRFAARLRQPPPRIADVRVAGFSRPSTVDECLSLLHDDEATLIAGGTDLAVDANLRGTRWPHLVSVEAIDELRAFDDTPDAIRIGAALPLSDLGRRWDDAPPVIGEWLALFASPPIRNRATLGGNLATASPIGDSAPLLLALDARVEIAGAKGRRTLPLASFFAGYRRTVLQRGELLTRIDIPKPLPERLRFYKVARRRLDDISTVAAAMALHDHRDGRPRTRLAFGGVAATPVRVAEAEAAFADHGWSGAAVERAQAIIARTLTPLSDHRGSKEYRLAVAQSLVEKFWWEMQA
jgi:xanthine dehydrogenase small subunit